MLEESPESSLASVGVFLRGEVLILRLHPARKLGVGGTPGSVADLSVSVYGCRRFQACRATAAPKARDGVPALAVAFQGHQKVAGSIPGRGDGGHGCSSHINKNILE